MSKRLFAFLFLAICILAGSTQLSGQSCDPSTPSYVVDLTGNPDSVWTSTSVTRMGLCCSASSPDVCIEFLITLDPETNGIKLEIPTGAKPGGALFYEVECANPTEVGDTLCLSGVGPHRITFCKPGGNVNTYSITAISKPNVSDPIHVSDGCIDTLYAFEFEEPTLRWTSVPYNATHNSYLSCTSGCDTVVVTADPDAPPYVDYEVKGLPIGGCVIDTIRDTVRVFFVSDKAAEITPVDPSVCFGGATTTLTANGSGGAPPFEYLWNTGATTQSVDVGAGTYWVRIADISNCPPVFDTVTVTEDTAAISAEAGPDQMICHGTSGFGVQLTGSVVTASGGTWSGGAGTYNPSKDSLVTTYFPTNAEITSGTMKLFLTTTGNGGCPDGTDSLTLNFAPEINVDFSVGDTCVTTSTQFINLSQYDSTASITWQWDFGDGNNSNLKDPNHTYGTAGNYNVTLIGTSDGTCTDTITKSFNFIPGPTADFLVQDSCGIDSINFTDQSAINNGTISNWNWNFGDSSQSNAQNPVHSFNTPGIYNVRLIVTANTGCTDTVTQQVSFYPGPVADFGFTDACIGNNTVFIDSSTISSGSIVTWSWDFGGGNTSNQQNPLHMFGADSIYPVSLIVTSDKNCTDSIQKMVNVTPLPVADFTVQDTCYADSAFFIDLSAATNTSIVTWHWDFGDGDTSTIQNPTHLYNTPGNHTISLRVETANGCVDSITKSFNIYPAPLANFTVPDVCFGDSSVFTDSSSIYSGSVVSWSWNFGDGNNSSQQNPVHYYNKDSAFTVQLVVTSDQNCMDTIGKIVNVFPVPDADFNILDACYVDSAFFVDQSSLQNDSLTNWSWDFGDGGSSSVQNPGHLYNTPGNYTVSLAVQSSNGCSDSISKNFDIHPAPLANFTVPDVCFGDSSVFTDSSSIPSGSVVSWSWDFGDGNNSTQQDPSHYYNKDSAFTVQLVVISDQNCIDTLQKTVNVFPVPVADFLIQDTCYTDSAFFVDQSLIQNDSVTSWSWDFGDGNQSTLQNPPNAYNTEGTYTVSLNVTSSNGCSDSISRAFNLYPAPVADFTSDDICFGSPSVFTDSSSIASGNIVSWQWNFGDGASDNTRNPVHQYNADSIYTVSLVVTSNHNCIDTLEKPLNIFAVPDAGFELDKVCINEAANFIDSSFIPRGTIVSWQWDFGDGGSDTVQNPFHTYTNVASRNIQLIVTSDNGCSDTITKTIDIIPSPIADFLTDETIIFPMTSLDFKDNSQGADRWNWDFGDGTGTSSVQHPNYTYSDTGHYQVKLIVYNTNNCPDSITKTIIARLNPKIPNAFTPNGDGNNDKVWVMGGPYQQLEFNIYNEWGELIFSTNDQATGWDGTRDSVDEPVGVYVYTVWGITLDNKEFREAGDITLIR